MKRLATLVATVLLASSAHAQRSYYDQNGHFAGSSYQHGNTTSTYDRNGHFNGSAITHGNTTTIYDRNGRFQGTVVNPPPPNGQRR